jgi:hypothetical protein
MRSTVLQAQEERLPALPTHDLDRTFSEQICEVARLLDRPFPILEV